MWASLVPGRRRSRGATWPGLYGQWRVSCSCQMQQCICERKLTQEHEYVPSLKIMLTLTRAQKQIYMPVPH